MHLLFVTDTSRRTRFAALHVLADILCMDSVRDMALYPHYTHAYNTTPVLTTPYTSTTHSATPQAVLLSQCAFLAAADTSTNTSTNTSTGNAFAEKIVLYLLTLAGACWSPQMIARLETSVGAAGSVGSAGGDVDAVLTSNPAYTADTSTDSTTNSSTPNTKTALNMSDNAKLVELLRFAPYLMTAHDSLTPQVLSPLSVVDKLTTKKESRHEICNQVVKVLITLCTVATYNTALCSVLQRVTQYASLLLGAGLVKLSYLQQLEVVGVALLVGGGTEGTYIGSNVRTFFSDVSGTILNINKTTNFAHVVRLVLDHLLLRPSTQQSEVVASRQLQQFF
jgi:hypothetical protein